MRRLISFLLGLFLMTSVACAEEFYSGSWIKRFYVDDFNDLTDEWYITTSISGTFSNSATTNSELTGQIMVDEQSIAFVLYEYDRYRIRNDSVTGETEYYTVKIKDSAGAIYDFEGFIPPDGDRIFISERYRQQTARILQGSGTIKFSVTLKDRSIPKYVFSIDDTTGFINLYLNNTIEQNSNVTYREMTEHYISYVTTADGSLVNSDHIYKTTYSEDGLMVLRETIDNDFPAAETFTYDDGRLISSHEEGISGVYQGKTIETRVIDKFYDENGNIVSTRTIRYDVDNKTYKYTGYDYSYQYDENGRLLHEEHSYLVLNSDGKITDKDNPTINDFSYQLNDDGTVQRKIRTTGAGKKYITDYQYDDLGRVIYEYTEPEDKSGSYWMTYESTFEYK